MINPCPSLTYHVTNPSPPLTYHVTNPCPPLACHVTNSSPSLAQEAAVLAKKSGKVLLPQYPTVQIFWSAAKPSQSKRMSSSGEPESLSPRSQTAQFTARPQLQGSRTTRHPKASSAYSWIPGKQAALTWTPSNREAASGSVEVSTKGDESTDVARVRAETADG